jgi:hypothetical protein
VTLARSTQSALTIRLTPASLRHHCRLPVPICKAQIVSNAARPFGQDCGETDPPSSRSSATLQSTTFPGPSREGKEGQAAPQVDFTVFAVFFLDANYLTPACPSPAPYLGSSSSIRYVSSWRRSPRSRFAIRNLKPSGPRRSTPASLFQQRQGHSVRSYSASRQCQCADSDR